MKKLFLIVIALFALAGCGGGSPVGLVDVQRLTSNWPQYMNAQNQLVADQRALSSTGGSSSQKASQIAALRQKYQNISNQLVNQVRDAAAKVAQQKQLRLVLTHEFVGYGGVDITPDVEKILGITEKPTPTP